jgi:hypothetical protein
VTSGEGRICHDLEPLLAAGGTSEVCATTSRGGLKAGG